jgi:hypothetical protein
MDRETCAIPGRPGNGVDREPSNEVTEAVRCGSRTLELRAAAWELRKRLAAINSSICGHNPPEPNPHDKREENLSLVLMDLEQTLGDCNRYAHAIEANLG